MMTPDAQAKAWLDFWNGETPIYANARHKRLHYEEVARDVAEYAPCRAARILDYGCGEALCAPELASVCERLYLYDAAPYVRGKLSERFHGAPGIVILDDGALLAVDDASLDLVVANSLVQYLHPAHLADLLALWRSKLKVEGLLLLSDIPESSTKGAFNDVLALLAFGWRGGFFVAALASLARLYFSDYRRLRGEFGFFGYEPAVIEKMLRRVGFQLTRMPRNIGHNQRRLCFLARKTQSSAIAETSRP